MADHSATYAKVPNNTASRWWRDPSLRLNVFYCLSCLLCPYYLGYDQALLTGLQAIPRWKTYFHNPKGNWLGLISAAIFIPGVVVPFPSDWISGRYGRKWCIGIGSAVVVAGAIWNAMSPNTTHFIVSRVMLGIGGSMTKVAAPALLQETAHPRFRASLAAMYYGVYYTGSLVSAIMCIIGLYIESEWAWRLPCLVMIVGPIIVLAILWGAPESPRFLCRWNKHDEARRLLAKFHANGDEQDPLVLWEMAEIQYALEQEESANKTSYLDLLRTPGNRKRSLVGSLIGIGCVWTGQGVVSYYLSPILNSLGITQPLKITGLNAGIAAWNLVLAEVAGLYADNFGRRPMFLTSTALMIVFFSCVMGFSAGFAITKKQSLGTAAVPFLFLFFGAYDLAWTPLNYSYVSEILPYNLRTKGLAIYLTEQNIANAFNQFVNPIALAAITWKYYAVYIGIQVFYLFFIYFYVPETKKLSIEEVSMVFDYGTKEGRRQAASELAAHVHVGKAVDPDGDKEAVAHVEDVQRV